jgi:hypothetical protein
VSYKLVVRSFAKGDTGQDPETRSNTSVVWQLQRIREDGAESMAFIPIVIDFIAHK